VLALTNDELEDTRTFLPISMEQYQGSADDFYDRMEALINPRPLDPYTMQTSLVDALEESVLRRVNSVDNGEGYMLANGFPQVEMPNGYDIFETEGPWEDFSTPSRDMRLLISIDTVLGFADSVRRRPEHFGLESAQDIEEHIGALRARLQEQLTERRFTYTRSDGSSWELTLSDVVARAHSFETAYNPNDCPEFRWGAAEGTPEHATCVRRAPFEQRELMESYRSWFAERERPPR
jgi:hypothetical protein